MSSPSLTSTPNSSSSSLKLKVLGVLAFVGIILAPYLFSGALTGGYTFDDVKLVKDNTSIRELSNIGEIFNIFSDRWDDEEVRPNYRPVRFLSYAIDYQIAKAVTPNFDPDNPPTWVFHTSNLIIHILNAGLVFFLARRLFGGSWAPWIFSLLFALHPIQTEAVVYISGRRDVLSLFFFLLVLFVYVGKGRGLFELSKETPREPSSWTSIILVPLFFILGLFSKEMVITLPAVMVLFDLCLRRRWSLPRVLTQALVWLIAGLFIYFKVTDESLIARPLGGETSSTWLTAPRYVVKYLSLLLIPLNQTIDYSYDAIPISKSFTDPWSTPLAWIFVLMMILGGLYALVKKNAAFAFGLLFFVGTLTPVLQFIPIPERFAERFVYLPGLGILLFLIATYVRWEKKSLIHARLTAVILLFICFIFSWSRCYEWRSPLALWASASQSHPRCARAHIGYGNELRAISQLRPTGDIQAKNELRKASDAYQKAISILEEDLEGLKQEPLLFGHLLQAKNFRADSLLRLTDFLKDKGEIQRFSELAITDYRWLMEQTDVDGKIVSEHADYFVLRYHLFLALLKKNEIQKAEEELKVMEAIASKNKAFNSDELVKASHYQLGALYRLQQDKKKAARAFQKAYSYVRENGKLEARYLLVGEVADALAQIAEYDQALSLMDPVIKEMGKDTRVKNHIFRVAKIYNLKGDIERAVIELEKALQHDPKFPAALLSLANLEEVRTNLDRAEELYKRLEKIQPGLPEVQKGLQNVIAKRELAKNNTNSEDEVDTQKRRLASMLQQGRLHFDDQQIFAAQDLFKKVAEQEPNAWNAPFRAEGLRLLGQIALKLRKFKDFEGFLLQGLEVDPDARDIYLDLADYCLAHRKEKERAERYLIKYVGYFEGKVVGKAHAYYNLALLLRSKAPHEALRLLDLARKAEHPRSEVLKAQAMTYFEMENWVKASEYFELYDNELEDPVEKKRIQDFVQSQLLPKLLEQELSKDPDKENQG